MHLLSYMIGNLIAIASKKKKEKIESTMKIIEKIKILEDQHKNIFFLKKEIKQPRNQLNLMAMEELLKKIF